MPLRPLSEQAVLRRIACPPGISVSGGGARVASAEAEAVRMFAQPIPGLTPEQYLEIERAAEFKSEYYCGAMYAMPGGTIPHSWIIARMIFLLSQKLEGGKCIVLTSDVRLRVSMEGLYTYPDITIVCGPLQYADDEKDTLLNPSVIVEVLSKSTEAHDRGFKFAQYQTLKPLQEYFLASQTALPSA